MDILELGQCTLLRFNRTMPFTKTVRVVAKSVGNRMLNYDMNIVYDIYGNTLFV